MSDEKQLIQMNLDLDAWGFPRNSLGIPKSVEELTEFVNRYYVHK